MMLIFTQSPREQSWDDRPHLDLAQISQTRHLISLEQAMQTVRNVSF